MITLTSSVSLLIVVFVALTTNTVNTQFLDFAIDKREASSFEVEHQISLTEDSIHQLFNRAAAQVEAQINTVLESTLTLRKKNKYANINNKGKSDLSKMRAATPETYMINKEATIALQATSQLLSDNYNMNQIRILQVPYEFCPFNGTINCTYTTNYRTADGTCNNENYPWWGKSFAPYKRFLPAVYDDGFNSPHFKSVVDGSPLPNPRTVATTLMNPLQADDTWTVLMTELSQFVFHDISFIARTSVDQFGNPLVCNCKSTNPDCLSISIPYNDYYFWNQQCMSTERSAASFRTFPCRMSEREQLNTVTSFLDMSNVYGNSLADSLRLRRTNGSEAGRGLLNWSTWPGINNPLLPIDFPQCPYARAFYSNSSTSYYPQGNYSYPNNCFRCGDARCNVNYELASLNLLWVREHNRIARILFKLNPNWSDQKLYQVARSISVANYQHMVYKELFPIQIGATQMANGFGNVNQYGGSYSFDYDPRIFPGIFNEIAAAVARFGHSMVSIWYTQADQNYYQSPLYDYSALVFNSQVAYSSADGTEGLMRGAMMQPNQVVDPHITDFLSNWLVINGTKISLPAMNIMRGRDHGIQGYCEYRKMCGLKANQWSDLTNVPAATITTLKQLYKNVQDIDLYVGINSETPLSGSLLGATASCLLAKQYRELRSSDRFFYEFGNNPESRFTPNQLTQIRKSSFARLLCDNFYYQTVLLNPLLMWDAKTNPFVSCSSLSSVNLAYWKDDILNVSD